MVARSPRVLAVRLGALDEAVSRPRRRVPPCQPDEHELRHDGIPVLAGTAGVQPSRFHSRRTSAAFAGSTNAAEALSLAFRRPTSDSRISAAIT